MGVLSDLVMAPSSEAERVAQAQVPPQEFEGIDIKGIDPVKLGTLHSILTGQSFDELLELYDPVVTVSDEGPWVTLVPAELVTRLAALDEAGRTEVAQQWANTEEFLLEGWDESDVASVLDSISSLAEKAVTSEQALFLWMCL